MTVAGGAPIASADFIALQNLTIYKPMCRVKAGATQTMGNSVAGGEPILFSLEDYDVGSGAGMHSTSVNTSRLIPTVPGYYTFKGFFVLDGTSVTVIDAWIRINGTNSLAGADRDGYSAATTAINTVQAEASWPMNGTTDYAELIGFQTSGASRPTRQNGQYTCSLEAIFQRSL